MTKPGTVTVLTYWERQELERALDVPTYIERTDPILQSRANARRKLLEKLRQADKIKLVR